VGSPEESMQQLEKHHFLPRPPRDGAPAGAGAQAMELRPSRRPSGSVLKGPGGRLPGLPWSRVAPHPIASETFPPRRPRSSSWRQVHPLGRAYDPMQTLAWISRPRSLRSPYHYGALKPRTPLRPFVSTGRAPSVNTVQPDSASMCTCSRTRRPSASICQVRSAQARLS